MSSSTSASSSSKPTPPPSKPQPSSSSAPSSAPVDTDLEQLLSREASAFQRELEVERILKAFKLNPYDILDLDETAKPEDIKRKYRQLSLYAFDILKKAESELSDAAKRTELDATIAAARATLLRSLSLPPNLTDDDPRIKDLADDPKMKAQGLTTPWRVMLKEKIKEVLIDEEVRRRKAIKMNLANEGLEARKKEEEVAARKRKVEEDKTWEETRETRVDSWRTFSNGGKKKKKAKVAILG